jgi:hypothetical protein
VAVALAAACAAPQACASSASSQQSPSEPAATEGQADSSPWLLMPILASNPKLGTSLGALVGYVHTFDEKSLPSMFGVTAQYTSTDSVVAGAFAKTSFDADHHRVIGGVFTGHIENDYDNFLGTGVPVKTEDNVSAFAARYLYRVTGDWFVGLQGVLTDYHIVGNSALDEQFLDFLGLTGFRSGGLGAVAMHDSRDNDNSPTHGWVANLNNIAYREALGGAEDFDVVRLDLRAYLDQGNGHVFALRQSNQWTFDAPAAAYAPVLLRGYTMGEYLGQNMSSFEVEERFRLGPRWTTTLFAGIAGLYGAGRSAGDYDNLYPTVGGGLQYLLKEKEGIVANLEFASGKDGNYGVYLKVGYGF